MSTINLIPAYGRDYRSQKAVKEAFDADRDFIVADISSRYDGSYANKSNLVNDGIKTVFIRYGQLRKVMRIAL